MPYFLLYRGYERSSKFLNKSNSSFVKITYKNNLKIKCIVLKIQFKSTLYINTVTYDVFKVFNILFFILLNKCIEHILSIIYFYYTNDDFKPD